VNVFWDTSVLLAAAKSSEGASRALFDYTPKPGWDPPVIVGFSKHGHRKEEAPLTNLPCETPSPHLIAPFSAV